MSIHFKMMIIFFFAFWALMQSENWPKMPSIAALHIKCTDGFSFWCENFAFNSIVPIKYGSAATKALPTIGLVYLNEWRMSWFALILIIFFFFVRTKTKRNTMKRYYKKIKRFY